MADLPVTLSAVSLRLAGAVGQVTLGRLRQADPATLATFDQQVTSVRAELTACREPKIACAQRAGLAAGRARGRATDRPCLPGPSCPDVPFVGSALQDEPVLPLRLLLHYACGFVEGAVRADWWPAEEDGTVITFESMRIAAICHLISRAEANGELPPDLQASALAVTPGGPR
jgi:Family of unknown function (DUF6401)